MNSTSARAEAFPCPGLLIVTIRDKYHDITIEDTMNDLIYQSFAVLLEIGIVWGAVIMLWVTARREP